MPLAPAFGSQSGLKGLTEFVSEEEARSRRVDDDDDLPELTAEEQERFAILRYCAGLLSEARRARQPYDTFDQAWDLFIGNVWPTRFPTWRAKITINKIRAFITFMQAIMTDNKPRISVDPLVPGSEDAADLLRKLVDRHWDEDDLQGKLSIFALYGLIWGTGVMKMTYDPYANGGRGKHITVPVVPYRIFTNRTATCVEDAEYIIQVEPMTFGWIRRNFPEKARAVSAVCEAAGGDERHRDRDFIREGDRGDATRIVSAQSVAGVVSGPQFSERIDEQRTGDGEVVEVQEFWLRDDSLEQYDTPSFKDGKPEMEPVVGEDGLFEFDVVGFDTRPSEIDGDPVIVPRRVPKMRQKMTTAWRASYPNGRLVMIAGGKILLRDIPSPYQIDGFPYATWKDYDVGSFFGMGEPLALKDASVASNRILSQVYDILEKHGNPSFMLKKGSGVNVQSIKNRPGAIIPMDDLDGLKALEKPQIPGQFIELYNLLQTAMGAVSGVNDSVMGAMPAANTAFATVDQLQESGAAPIRLKVRNMESGIARIGRIRIQLIQQFDRGARPIRERGDNMAAAPGVVAPAGDVAMQFRTYTNADLQGQVEFGIVPISSLSTSPAGAWNKWMALFDKHLVDRRWFHTKWRIEGWRTELPRMEATEKADAMAAAAAKNAGKAKPGPDARPGKQQKPPSPRSHVPTRRHNASVR